MLRYSPFVALAALALAVGACTEDQPTGNDTLDPTLPKNPCDSGYARSVGPNGFIMSGTGFQGQVVKFVDFNRTFETEESGPDSASLYYRIQDTLDIKGDPTTGITVEMHIQSYKPNTFEFNNEVGDPATYLRVELRQDGIKTKVYRSIPGEGHIVLDSMIAGARAYGRFCGLLQDSLSRAQIAVMNGRFAVAE